MEITDVAENLKIHLEADIALGFIDAFDIGQYGEDPLPEFDNRCCQISLSTFSTEGISGTAYQVSQESISLDLVCVVKITDSYQSLYGKNTGQEGILKMCLELKKSIRTFCKNTDGLDFVGNETHRPVLKIEIQDRKEFFREYKLPVTIRLEAEVRLR